MRHRLENSSWGFSSNCFVCDPANGAGLQIPFSHDDETGVVDAEFVLDDRFSGTPNYIHGGIALAILDEAMAWATIAVLHTFAVTRTMTTTFHRPVKVGRPYRVEASVADPATDDGDIVVSATVQRGTDGMPCVDAVARFVPLSPRQAGDAIGAVEGTDARYLRG